MSKMHKIQNPTPPSSYFPTVEERKYPRIFNFGPISWSYKWRLLATSWNWPEIENPRALSFLDRQKVATRWSQIVNFSTFSLWKLPLIPYCRLENGFGSSFVTKVNLRKKKFVNLVMESAPKLFNSMKHPVILSLY